MANPRVCVVGSSNLDLNASVERFPAPGETLHGSRFTTGFGGKGANQAVMAARLGADVALITRVGNDSFGRDLLEHYRREGLDTTFALATDGVATGVALIAIDAAGRNQIIVIPGANGRLTPEDIERARGAIESATVLACQMEVPLETNLAAMRIAHRAGATVLFNPAPAPASLPDEVFALCSVFCPNEHEAASLSGEREPAAAAKQFLDRGARHVIITLGERGCLLVNEMRSVRVPAPCVTAIDTTGAGDAFLGCLAYELARGADLEAAATRACRVAAWTVQRTGTQTSFPPRGERFSVQEV